MESVRPRSPIYLMNVAIVASNLTWYSDDLNVTYATNFHYWTPPPPELQPTPTPMPMPSDDLNYATSFHWTPSPPELQPTPTPMPMPVQPFHQLQVYSPNDGKQMVVYDHRGLGIADFTAGILVFFSALLSSKMMRHHPAVY